jgi:hypothetical protein
MWVPVLLLITVRSALPSARPQLPERPNAPVPAPGADSRDVLKREAAKFSPRDSSRLLADLADVEVAKRLAFSPEQRELLVSVEELTRDIYRAWLLRDLDADPRPSATELAGRLAHREQVRSRLLGHVDAIVLEGVLSPEQARRWRLTAHQRAAPLLRSRLPNLVPTVTGDESRDELVANLRLLAKCRQQAGCLFFAIIPVPNRPGVVLPEAQQTLVKRVDHVAATVIRKWMTRELDGERKASWSVLANRYRLSARVADSLGAHAEAIVLEVVLRPEETDRALAHMWSMMQLSALLDPQFAAKLRLSASQRRELEHLVPDRTGYNGELSKLGDIGLVIEKMPRGPDREDLLQRASAEYLSDLEAGIWGVLNASQARELERILDIKPQAVPRAKQKKRTRPG